MRTRFIPLFVLSFASLILAQEPAPQGGAAADPPGRAARLSYLNGAVSFQPGGVEDWTPAELNRPITTGDRVWTEDGARAELNLGTAAFRLNGRTNFTFLNLDDRTAQVQLSLGTLNVRVRRLADDETFEIDTPQLALTLLRPGDYRIEVNEAGDTTVVTVRSGDAEGTANGQAFPVHARDQFRVTAAEGSEPVIDRRVAPPGDAFDNFCQDRDRREDLSPSGRYVSRDTPGYADLDANGTWRVDPQYGAVWVPNTVPVGWSPYHYGHWAYIAPWGWTWIDDAPWGYAPFHYGRWAMVGGVWVWVPGPVAPRPVYAPAMVAFVGGAGFGVAVGGGAVVGWFPLGPREVFVPTYAVSAAYVTRINVTNTVVTEVAVRNVYAGGGAGVVYANRAAVVAVRGDAMVAGRPIAAAAVRLPPGAVERVQVMRSVPVAPARAAVLGGRAPIVGAAHLPPAAAMNRRVVARMTPPAAVRANVRVSTPARLPARVEATPLNNRQNAAPEPRPAPASHPAAKQEERAPKKSSKPAKKTSKPERDK